MSSFTQVSPNNPAHPSLPLYLPNAPTLLTLPIQSTKYHSVSSTDHEAPHYAVSCSQLSPSSSQPQVSPSALYSQTSSVYVPTSE